MLLTLLLGCDQTAPSSQTLPLTPCHVTNLDAESLCGTLSVPEDPSALDGKTIDLHVLVVPAVSPNPEPDPLFFLAGGPGQAASEVAAAMLPALDRVQKRRDLVFVDQRGTGKSAPLHCPDPGEMTLAEELALDSAQFAVDCLASLDTDPGLYITPIAMDDLDAVREALGYETINLYGASYGTRAGLVYMRRHPERVRTAILDGVAPLEMVLGLHFATDGHAALTAVFDDCAASLACAEAFPTLAVDFQGLLDSLPRTIDFTQGRTGEPEMLELTRELLVGGVRGQLYSPTFASLLPLAITDAVAGDFSPIMAQTIGFSEGMADSMSDGMQLAVLCAEDVHRLPADLGPFIDGTFLGDAVIADLAAVCAGWPTPALPDGYYEPVKSDAPTLLLSGVLDPVTPPRWADLAAETLPNSRHLIAPGAGHNVAPLGCVPRLMAEFIDAGSAADLETDCVDTITRPPFFIDFAGPAK
ncbi:MAG: pimeloyl-ACP methyl ester carboxylesterase [Myxococcota bacterium]|jgi:pimeloyl-ACP methyl ester carboxylesterase